MHEKNRVLDRASIVANLLVGDVDLADIALVLHLDKVDINNDPAYLHDVSDNVIGLNGFKQSQLCVCLEVTDLVLDLTYYLNISRVKLHLGVHIQFVRNLSEGIGHQYYLVFGKVVFEVDAARVSYEERDLTLIINTLNVNLRVDLSKACIGYNLIVFGVLVIL